MSEEAQPGGISWSEVMATGFASTAAAGVTSEFGVDGTIGGAGVTAMIAAVGAAILKSYFESAAGNTREARGARLPRADEARSRMFRFGRLPALDRRSILVKGLIGAFLIVVVGVIQVTGVEVVISNSFSCGFWGTCPLGANPGIHLVADRGTGAGFSVLGGRSEGNLVPITPTPTPAPTGGPSPSPSPGASPSPSPGASP